MAKTKAVSQLIYENDIYKTNQAKIADLIKLGYSRQQARDWIRKINIQMLFEKDEKTISK